MLAKANVHDKARMLLVAQAIEMWRKHKMELTRGFTISLALEQATAYTKKKYKKTEASFTEAIADLQKLLDYDEGQTTN